MTAPIIPGAEPYSATGDARGALVLHGFTGNPQSMRGLALALADAGFTVEMPLLPGHGTDIADMVPTRWADWSRRGRGGLHRRWRRAATRWWSSACRWAGRLAVWLAEHHPEIAALAVVNPLSRRPTRPPSAFIQAMIEGGDEVAPGIGSDIAMEGAVESAYPGLPLRAALSLFDGVAEVEALLGSVDLPGARSSRACRTTSSTPSRASVLVERVKGPVEQVVLERSYHVATLDYDKDEIEARTVEFLTGVLRRSPRP